MANTGRNKLVKYARIFVDGYDLSGDARNISSAGIGYGEVNMTGWSNTSMQYLTDKYLNGGIEGFQAHFNDTANSGSYANLKDSASGKEVMLFLGGNAEPTDGDIAYILASAQTSANITFDGGATIINANFRMDTVTYNEWPLGNVISPNTSRSATFQGVTLDNGAATANGWHAILMVIASTGGTWSFAVRHSTDDASYSDLATATLNGSTIGSEHLGGTGTVNRYVRLEGIRTSGTVTVVCGFARNIG